MYVYLGMYSRAADRAEVPLERPGKREERATTWKVDEMIPTY